MTTHIHIERGDDELKVLIEADYSPRVPCTHDHPSEDEQIDIYNAVLEDGTDVELTPEETERAHDAIRDAANSEWEEQESENDLNTRE